MWFIVPYKRRLGGHRAERYCAMDDFTPQIFGEGGTWAETEILGDRAIVKVSASLPTLAMLTMTFQRLPLDRLSDSLSDLTSGQRSALRDLAESCGYHSDELQEALGIDMGRKRLRDFLRFLTLRRREPRYDAVTDEIVCDGLEVACRSIDSVDRKVPHG